MGRKRPPSFEGRTFGRLERVVTALVEAGLQDRAAAPPNLIERLLHLERSAFATGGDRQILQVIASGLRLLGFETASNVSPEPTEQGLDEALFQNAMISADRPEADRNRPASPAGAFAMIPPARLPLHDTQT